MSTVAQYTYAGAECLATKPLNFTHTFTGSVTRVNRYEYTGPVAPKTKRPNKDAGAEQAIIDTIKCLGWISLKDSDHNEYGKGVGQGDARRRAADRMIADGRVVLLGTWSNGIAVGPGAGFCAVAQREETPAPVVKSKPARKPRKSVFRMIDTEYEEQRMREELDDIRTGNCCAWAPELAPAMHGPAYVPPLGNPPGYILHDNRELENATAIWHAYLDMLRRHENYAITNEHGDVIAPAQPVSAAPTPIYQPTVGESVFIVLRHDNGTTTDRVVDVQRVKLEGGVVTVFRGYDRRRDRCRNYNVADCLVMRAWDGMEVLDMKGRVVVEARAA